MSKNKYPELEAWGTVHDTALEIITFVLECLDTNDKSENGIERQVCKYFGIDFDKREREREEMEAVILNDKR